MKGIPVMVGLVMMAVLAVGCELGHEGTATPNPTATLTQDERIDSVKAEMGEVLLRYAACVASLHPDPYFTHDTRLIMSEIADLPPIEAFEAYKAHQEEWLGRTGDLWEWQDDIFSRLHVRMETELDC